MTSPAPAAVGTPRLVAVDVARCLALIGMMAVHVLPGPAHGAHPVTAAAYELASGRASALFAVLAGVGLALGRPSRWEVVVRALAVLAIGLTLGIVPTPAAVILVFYGVLFLLAIPFLRLPVRALAALAVLWALLAPVAGHLLRAGGLEAYPEPNPQWPDLAHPLVFARNVLLTGYYPALTWLAYLLAGLAAGTALYAAARADGVERLARRLVAIGAGTALAGWALGALTLRLAGGVAALNTDLEGGPPNAAFITGRGDDVLRETFFGVVPTTHWWWLGIRAPHSASIADLLHTGGCALLVLGVALLVVPWLTVRIPRVVRAFGAAGSMTLTLYAAHVVLLGLVAGLDDPPPDWLFLAAQVVVALVLADRWRFGGPVVRRGPLEELVSVATDPVRGRT